eukprot:36790_1
MGNTGSTITGIVSVSCRVRQDQESEFMGNLTKVTKTKTAWMNGFWETFYSNNYCIKITMCTQEAQLLREIALMKYIQEQSKLQAKMDQLHRMYLQDESNQSMFKMLNISDEKIERFEYYFKTEGADRNWKDKNGTVIDPTDDGVLWHEMKVKLIRGLQEPYKVFNLQLAPDDSPTRQSFLLSFSNRA